CGVGLGDHQGGAGRCHGVRPGTAVQQGRLCVAAARRIGGCKEKALKYRLNRAISIMENARLTSDAKRENSPIGNSLYLKTAAAARRRRLKDLSCAASSEFWARSQ